MKNSSTPNNPAQPDDPAIRIEKAAKDNPDLSRQFVENTLRGMDEADAGKLTEYR